MRIPGKIRFAFAATFALAPLIAGAAGSGTGVDEIDFYHRVNDRVAVGGQPTPAQVVALAQAGFRAIIDLREESEAGAKPEAEAAKDAGVRYIPLPVSKTSPTDEQVEQFLRVTDDADIYPVFIHCVTANRAATLWMIRRVLRDGRSLEEAEKEAAEVGLTSEALRKSAREYIQSHGRNAGS